MTLARANEPPLDPSPQSPINRDDTGARLVVVMGVSGTGKSTLGEALARAMRLPFIDGDDVHPAANVAKMSRGEPLVDADRWPWLAQIRSTAVARVQAQVAERVGDDAREPGGRGGDARAWRPGVIVACSALKRTYRTVLRGEGVQTHAVPLRTYFVYLKGDRAVLMARMVSRQGHFMKAGMLESQLDTLESPEDESGVVTVSAEMTTEEQVQRVVALLSREWDGEQEIS